MIVVTGNAPRSGTSAMMRALLEYYEPHSYCEKFPAYVASICNPDGFWDLNEAEITKTDSIPTEPNTVIKLWANHLRRVNADDVKVLVHMVRRDFQAQVQSIFKTAIAEGFRPDPETVSKLFITQDYLINELFVNTPKIVVDMEDFRKNPKQFISSIREIL
jgi:hypothetical protein